MRLHTQPLKLATVATLICVIVVAAGALTAHGQDPGDGPFLAAEPLAFDFHMNVGDSIIGESLYVYEISGDNIPFWTSTGSGNEWLEVDTMSASPLITPEVIFLNVRTEGLAPGTYADTIAILSGVSWQAVFVPVTLHVDAGEQILQYMPDSFYVYLHQGEGWFESLYVSELYGGAVSFTVAVSEPWLVVDAPGLSPPYTTPVTLGVHFNMESLPAGIYTDSIVIMPTDPTIPYDTLPVTVIIYDEPSVVVIPNHVDISLGQGQMAELKSFYVYEEHGDDLAFMYETTLGSPWLVFQDSLQFGITPDSVVYNIYTGGLAPGVYVDTVHFFSGVYGLPFPDVYVPITLTVEAMQPHMVVDPYGFDFRAGLGDTLYDSVFVYEEHGLPMTFDAITYHGDWLSIPDYPTPMPMPGYIPFMIHTEGLAPGEYYDTLEVHGYDESPLPREHEYDISIRLIVDTVGYVLIAEPEWLEYTMPPFRVDSGFVHISEIHGANVPFEMENNQPWLILPLYSDTPTTPFYLIFGVDTDSLPIGVYYDTITVTPISGEPLYIHVTLNVTEDAPIILATAPQEYFFTLDRGEQGFDSLHVYETGGQSINFWTYNYSTWLYVDTMAVVPLYTPETLPIIVNTDNLEAGYYSDTIVLYAYGADNTPLLVPVSLTVVDDSTGDYIVDTYPSSFTYYQDEGTIYDSLHVVEEYGRSVPFHFFNRQSWVVVEPLGMYPYYTPMSLAVITHVDTMPTGVYYDTIFIVPSSPDYLFDTVAVPLTLTVGNSGDFVVRTDPTFMRFYLDPGEVQYDSLLVYEIHNAALPFYCEWDASWFDVLGTYQYPFYTPEVLFIRVNDSGLTAGVYIDTLYIMPDSEDFMPVPVPIGLTVMPDLPVVMAEPGAFSFTLTSGDSATFNNMLVYEQTGLNLLFDITTSFDSDWLVIEPSDSVYAPHYTPEVVYFSVFTTGLDPGIYSDTIIFYYPLDDTLAYDDVKVPVVLTVTGDPGKYVVKTDPESFLFIEGGGTLHETMYVYEEHGAEIPFDFYNLQPWVWVYYDDTLLQLTGMELWMTVHVDTMPAGIYYDTIFITATSMETWFDTVAVPLELIVPVTPGDLNGDGVVNLLDVLLLIMYLYQTHTEMSANPLSAGDVNGDGQVDLLDILYLIDFLYGEPAGPPPVRL